MDKNNDFEKSLVELENIADSLESENLSLDESIKLFEKGIKLSKQCNELLKNAKQRIDTISNSESEVDD